MDHSQLVVTPDVNSRESTLNADLPQETATNSDDAKELPPIDSADQLNSRDLMLDAYSLEPLKENVTEVVSANKQKTITRSSLSLLFFQCIL